jgi:hypothetical protein
VDITVLYPVITLSAVRGWFTCVKKSLVGMVHGIGDNISLSLQSVLIMMRAHSSP